MEPLERRELLAADLSVPWHNAINPLDVNQDNRVTPHDALLVINHLIVNGAQPVPEAAAAPQSTAAGDQDSNRATQYYLDVNGDNFVSPIDALRVINLLATDKPVQISVFPTDLAGTPISEILVGSDFLLQSVTQDIRDPANAFPGIFSTFLDVRFDSSLASIPQPATFDFDPFFNVVQTFDATVPGLITGAGAAGSSLTPPGNDPQELWTVLVHADAVGDVTFTPSFDTIAGHEVLLFDPADILTADMIDFVGASLKIALNSTINVASVADAEGNSGTTNFAFTVSLSGPFGQPITVEYGTANPGSGNAATAGVDYQSNSGTLTFSPGTTQQVVTVLVNGDLDTEPDEIFNFALSNPTNVTLGTNSVVAGTILNDDVTPMLTIADVIAAGAATGTTEAVFTVTLNQEVGQQVTVSYATQDNTAEANEDYLAESGTLTFSPGGSLMQTVTVPILANPAGGPDETFFVNLLNADGATIEDAQALGTIVRQGLSISSTSVLEGNSGQTDAIFTISLSQSPQDAVTVAYSTADDTATVADGDYAAQSGTVSFAPGETSKTVTVAVSGDTNAEPNETFFVNLSDANGTPIHIGQGIGTILNDDGQKAIIQLLLADESGDPLPGGVTLDVGDNFMLQAFVQDAQADPNGIAAAYLDVFYDSNRVAINGPITFGPLFTNVQSGNTSTPGLIDEVGAFGQFEPPPQPGDPQLLFSIAMTTLDVGLANFVADPADLPQSDVLEYTSDVPIPPASINYVDASINIGINAFTVDGVEMEEGNSGTTDFVFTISRFRPSAATASVVYSTSDDTAVAGEDYVAQTGTLTFAPGETAQTVTVAVNGDTIDEPDEAFSVVLSDPISATIARDTATGTITNDDDPPSVSIGDVTQAEGNSGTTDFVFTATLSRESGKTVTVLFATNDGTATDADNDYEPTSVTITFAPGVTSQVVTVAVNGDTVDEDDEAFTVTLSSPSNATLGDAAGLGTINDDDDPPSVSIGNVTQAEGNSGTTDFVFTATLSRESSKTVTVEFATNDVIDGATEGSDYVGTSGTLTFAPSESTKVVTVVVNGDTDGEQDETFQLALSNPTNATVSQEPNQGLGTILNDDGPPTFRIGDTTTVGRAAETVDALFTVDLSVAFDQQITVSYATQDNTAVANEDYLARSGILTFVPGVVQQLITVPILGNPSPSDSETFFVNLSSVIPGPPEVTISDAQALGTIERRGITITSTSVLEGNSGPTDTVFTVNLSQAEQQEVTVEYSTADDTATVGNGDYVSISGTLTFAAGETEQKVTVVVNGDTAVESNETFFVNLSNATGSVIFTSPGIGTILNDDGQKALIQLKLADDVGDPLAPGATLSLGQEFQLQGWVQDVQTEPNGIAAAYLDVFYDSNLVTIDDPIMFGPLFTNVQSGDTSIPGLIDEVGAFGQLVPPPAPGDPQLLFSIALTASDVGLLNFIADPADVPRHEVLEYFSEEAIPPAAINYIGTSINIGTNVFTVDSVEMEEGDSGTTDFVFTVTRFLPSGTTASVVYSTSDEAAVAGTDYVAQTGTLTFMPGDTSKTVTIAVNGDVSDENDETFFVGLSDPVGAVASVSPGVGTIINDDGSPELSVADANGDEGEDVVFTVSLSIASGKTVTVAYTTADSVGGTPATAGDDYEPVSGTLTFAPGVTQQTASVPALSDLIVDDNETFQLLLSDPTNATISTASAEGLINDVPPAMITGYVYADMNNNGLMEGTETGIANVIVQAIRDGVVVKSTLTGPNGDYSLVGLPPETYSVRQIQPGFFLDGRDTRFGVDSPTNDRFDGIELAPSAAEAGFNFGERGLRPEFVPIFLNRRAFFASSIVSGQFGPATTTSGLDLRTGDVWVSFDGGWEGTRTIQALFDTSAGSATMTLYNNDLVAVGISGTTADGAQLMHTGTAGSTFFLQISGTSSNVTLQALDTISIDNVSKLEGDAGTTDFVFTVSLSTPQTQSVTANYTTVDGTADSDDYVAQSGTVSFAPGETSRLLTITVNGDTDTESDEAFSVVLSSPTNILLGLSSGLGTIQDDDGIAINGSLLIASNSSATDDEVAPAAATASPATSSDVAVQEPGLLLEAEPALATSDDSSSATDAALEEDEDWVTALAVA